MAHVDGLRFSSSVLPWRSCGTGEPWVGEEHAEKTAAAVAAVEVAAPDVWGGDWNHALSGREWSGSVAGRRSVLEAVERLGLQVPTTEMPHQIEGLLSIDHVAVPEQWHAATAWRLPVYVGGVRLADHDAYVVAVER